MIKLNWMYLADYNTESLKVGMLKRLLILVPEDYFLMENVQLVVGVQWSLSTSLSLTLPSS